MCTPSHEPFFIVGAPRSGTTLLAVLLDRHHQIAIPPETQFFTEFLPLLESPTETFSCEQVVARALSFERISDLNLPLQRLQHHLPSPSCDAGQLLKALLTTYKEMRGASRVGEKSPLHLLHLEEIRNHIPKAKFICIIRDGRDVVRSLLEVNWAEPGNPRRFWLFCQLWNQCTENLLTAKEKLGESSLLVVHYEKLLRAPREELTKVCHFLDVEFETSQLQPNDSSSTVPEWEYDWKQKANDSLDISRIGAWRNNSGKEEICAMNVFMGEYLQKLEYTDTEILGCSLVERFKARIIRLSFTPFLRPAVLLALKGLKLLGTLLKTKRKE